MVQAPEAIAFVHFGWSGQSVQSLMVVEDLERLLWTNAAVYRIDPDDHTNAAAWLMGAGEKQGKDLVAGGYGSVLWMKSGEVVDWVPFAAKSGLEELIDRTSKAFS